MTRVLVVDDNPQDRLLVRRALLAEFEDAEVLEAPDQATLDTLLASHQFDAVVTDFRLRWSDGLKVLDAIHAKMPTGSRTSSLPPSHTSCARPSMRSPAGFT